MLPGISRSAQTLDQESTRTNARSEIVVDATNPIGRPPLAKPDLPDFRYICN